MLYTFEQHWCKYYMICVTGSRRASEENRTREHVPMTTPNWGNSWVVRRDASSVDRCPPDRLEDSRPVSGEHPTKGIRRSAAHYIATVLILTRGAQNKLMLADGREAGDHILWPSEYVRTVRLVVCYWCCHLPSRGVSRNVCDTFQLAADWRHWHWCSSAVRLLDCSGLRVPVHWECMSTIADGKQARTRVQPIMTDGSWTMDRADPVMVVALLSLPLDWNNSVVCLL